MVRRMVCTANRLQCGGRLLGLMTGNGDSGGRWSKVQCTVYRVETLDCWGKEGVNEDEEKEKRLPYWRPAVSPRRLLDLECSCDNHQVRS